MLNGTTRRTNTRADVLAPFPSGLIRCATNCHSAEMDHLEFPFLHHAYFIGLIERFQNNRYLLAIHPPLNIEKLLIKSKALSRSLDHLWIGNSASRPGDLVPAR